MFYKYILAAFLLISTGLLTSCFAATLKQDTPNILAKNLKEPENRSDWKKILNWPEICDEGVSHISPSFIGVDTYTWYDDRQLTLVVCTTGAYNQGLMFFLETKENSGKYTLLSFPQFIADDDASGHIDTVISGDLTKAPFYKFSKPLLWGALRSDMSNYTITNNNKYRGSGGCGISTSYQIINDQVKVSMLKIKNDCDGSYPPASQWSEIPESEFSTWPNIVLAEKQ